MSATNEVTKYFITAFEKKNVRILMDMIFPEGGEVENHGRIKGERGLFGWIAQPEVWWDIRCNKTGKSYHIRFKAFEKAVGTIYSFFNGKGYQNFTFIRDEEGLKKSIAECIQSDDFKKLVH